MSMLQLLFYLFAALTLVSAMLVVTVQNLVRSIFLFFVTLFAIAGLYVFALADFIAITQVIVYVGGVLVLMLFAFMLSDKTLLTNIQTVKPVINMQNGAGLVVAAALFFVLYRVASGFDADAIGWLRNADHAAVIQPTDDTISQIGIHTMTRYLLPFEVVSVFLMMALIGAAHLARKDKNV